MSTVSTWSAKIDDEEKEKLQILIDESGLSSKDFLQNLITVYELNNSKIHVVEIAQDINEIQQLTQRVNNIFINVAERIEGIKTTSLLDKESALSEKNNIIHAMTEMIDSLKAALNTELSQKELAIKDQISLVEKYNQLKSIYDRESSQLSETSNNQQLLIQQYKEKVDTLSSIVIENQGKINNFNELTTYNDKLEASIYQTQKENDQLKEALKSHRDTLIELSNTKDLADSHTQEISTLKNTIEQLKERHSLEIDKSLIKAEKSYNDSLQKIQEEYNRSLLDLVSLLKNGQNNSVSTSPSKK